MAVKQEIEAQINGLIKSIGELALYLNKNDKLKKLYEDYTQSWQVKGESFAEFLTKKSILNGKIYKSRIDEFFKKREKLCSLSLKVLSAWLTFNNYVKKDIATDEYPQTAKRELSRTLCYIFQRKMKAENAFNQVKHYVLSGLFLCPVLSLPFIATTISLAITNSLRLPN